MKKIISKSFYFEAAHKLNITENKESPFGDKLKDEPNKYEKYFKK